MGMWSVAKRVLVLMPTKSGEPRRVATHWSGKCFDLNANANAPSYTTIHQIHKKNLFNKCKKSNKNLNRNSNFGEGQLEVDIEYPFI